MNSCRGQIQELFQQAVENHPPEEWQECVESGRTRFTLRQRPHIFTRLAVTRDDRMFAAGCRSSRTF
jgi:hypothetical protein